jgi:hypothetical protein
LLGAVEQGRAGMARSCTQTRPVVGKARLDSAIGRKMWVLFLQACLCLYNERRLGQEEEAFFMGRARSLATGLFMFFAFPLLAATEPVGDASSRDAGVKEAKPKFVRCIGHDRRVESVVLTPDAKWAVSGGEDPYLIVWDSETGREVRRIMRKRPGEETGPALSLHLTPDGKKVGALSGNNTVEFWDIATGEPAQDRIPLGAPSISWALSSDGSTLARGSFTDLSVRDVKQNKVLWTKEFDAREIGMVNALAFSSNGRRVAAALLDPGVRGNAKKVRVWDVSTGQEQFSAWPESS